LFSSGLSLLHYLFERHSKPKNSNAQKKQPFLFNLISLKNLIIILLFSSLICMMACQFSKFVILVLLIFIKFSFTCIPIVIFDFSAL